MWPVKSNKNSAINDHFFRTTDSSMIDEGIRPPERKTENFAVSNSEKLN